MKLDIMYIISERDKREREKDEGRQLPLYIEPPCNGEKGVEDGMVDRRHPLLCPLRNAQAR